MLLFDDPADRELTFAQPDDGKSYAQVAREAVTNLADVAQRPQVYKRIFDASWQAQTYVENSNARSWAENESLSRIIGAVRTASGIRLDNPREGGFEDEGDRLARDRLGDGYGAARAQGPRALDPFRMQAFEDRLAQLAESDPKIADAIATAKIDFSPTMIARRADMDMQAAMGEAGSMIGAVGAAIGGGVVPSFRDPINAAGLFAGAGPSAATSVAGRIAVVAAREALINAGITAAQQPFTQGWRQEAGLSAGLGEAIQNIALAAGVGGVFGGGVQGVRELVGLVAAGKVAPAELRQALDQAGLRLPEEEAGALRAAEQVDAADALVMREAPAGLSREEAVEVLRQAIRHAEDPVNEPLPDLPIALPPARADRAAVTDEALPAALGDVATVDGKPVAFARFDPATIGTDAAQMQYKGGADAAGVTERLRSVTRWDPLAGGRVFVFERADGSRVIADGHQRLGLARRLSTDSEPAELVGHLFREADGWTAADVRAMAAKKNMQEGSGTALDAARVLRDRPDMADGALPVTGPMMRQAVQLARLSDEAFGMVNAGLIPEAYGARVGAMVADPLQHVAVLADLLRFKPETEREASLLIGESLRAGFVAERQEDMFGTLDRTVSLMGERIKVLDQAVRQLATDKRVFGMLGREAERIEAGGNVLAATNAERAAAAAELQDLVVRLAQRMGPISDLLTDAARAVKDGGKATEAARGFIDNVAATIEREGLPRLMSEPALRPVDAVEPGTPQALAAAERIELRPTFVFRQDDPGNLRPGEKYFEVTRDGEEMAGLYIRNEGDTARILDIYRPGGSGANTLGAPAVRQMLRDFQRAYPEVKALSGERVTGGRAAAGKPDRETTVNLRAVESGSDAKPGAVEQISLREDETIDLFGDSVPMAARDNPMGTRIVTREEALAEADRTGFFGDLVASCKA